MLVFLASCAPHPSPQYSDLASEQRIEFVQQRLNELNFEPGPVDGKLGPQTRRAIRKFQVANGLSPDGKISEALYARLSNPVRNEDTIDASASKTVTTVGQLKGNWSGELDCGQSYGKRQRANARISLRLNEIEGQQLVGRISWRGVSAYRTGSSRARLSLSGSQGVPLFGELETDEAVNRLSHRWKVLPSTADKLFARRLSRSNDTIHGECVLILSRR